MGKLYGLLGLSVLGSMASCAPRAPSAAPIDVPVQPSPEPLEITETVTIDASAPVLPPTWTERTAEGVPFAEALAAARNARAAFETAAAGVMTADGGTPLAAAFERVNALFDRASRRYAGAYHAPDVEEGNRVATLREAAEMMLAWAKTLDAVGLGRTPASYRASAEVSLSFEDIAKGPAKRWREEGLALLQLCAQGGDGRDARECATLRRSYAMALAKRAADAGAGSCCDPGDPMCSASLSGWCRPN